MLKSWLTPFYRVIHKLHRRTISVQAVLLNQALFADVDRIPPAEVHRLEEHIRHFSQERSYSEEYTRSWISHRYRIYLTLQWLAELARSASHPLRGLELGKDTLVSDLLRKYLPQVKWENTSGDLRYPWPQADASTDLIVCTEFIEHLSDPPDGFNETFYQTGVKNVLKECHRVLSPGGTMLITTPNAASMFHIHSVLYGRPPWFYPLHVREYTAPELIQLLEALDFIILSWRAIHCMTIDLQMDYRLLFQSLLDYGYPTENRGDDLFFQVQKKPAN